MIEEMKEDREVGEKRLAEMTQQLEKIKAEEKKAEGKYVL